MSYVAGPRGSEFGVGVSAGGAAVAERGLSSARRALDALSPSDSRSAETASAAAAIPTPAGGPDSMDPARVRFAERLDAALAQRLRHGLPALNLASAVACLVLAAFWWQGGSGDAVGPWVALGGVALAIRLILLRAHASDAAAARRFLMGSIGASAAVGLMLAWGWVAVLPRSSGIGVEMLLIAHVAVLLVALCASGIHVPSFLALVLVGSVPLVVALGQAPLALHQTLLFLLGLGLVSVVAVAFSVRFSKEFHDTFALKDRVERLLEEVSVKRDEAVSATQAKSRFLASVSHDLRQPMHAMNLYLASVAGHFDKLRAAPGDMACARSVQEGIRSLQDSTLYLNTMFESLLDISRLNAGSIPVNLRYTTVHRMMKQLEADYSRQAAAQGLRFDMRVPPQFHLMEVQTDPALLERLLRNLLVNAFRYTRAGGVRLSVIARGRSLDFRVVDTGPGIERAMRRRVFEEFFQVPGSQDIAMPPSEASERANRGANRRANDSAAAHGGREPALGRGIGLGLSISARLAGKLGSTIRLHSHLGRGSVFALRQPMRVALRPRSDALPSVNRAVSAKLPKGLFLAVIDDDLEIRRSTRQMLEVLGIEVYTAESASQAVQQLGRQGRVPDLLLSDYRLGNENGVEAITRLREEFNQDIPAILITGDTSPERLEEFRQTGLRVLYKPISGSQLLAAVEEELQSVRAAAP